MNAQDLAALIAGGETLAVEFKSERAGSLSDYELVEMACMANRDDDREGWALSTTTRSLAHAPGTRPRGRTCCACRRC